MNFPKPEQEYLEHLRAGRFMLQRSQADGKYHFYPRVAAPLTGNRDLEWVPASGDGTIHAVTVIYPRPPGNAYNVVLVDLSEGPRVMSRVEGIAPEDVRIGMRVKAIIRQEADGPILLFSVAA